MCSRGQLVAPQLLSVHLVPNQLSFLVHVTIRCEWKALGISRLGQNMFSKTKENDVGARQCFLSSNDLTFEARRVLRVLTPISPFYDLI